ncbi:hypothetical protein [Plastoroseomonas hellenica]|uniref:hypothetical protein n=1 Tax=Plastoroseomonas hellenica TaxID=2687306 RepID=UPI001BA7F1E1|nr:hypothetical protein [Plastoroseomonas hellenica]MBR0647434.1 hypothetical protein [Plastoroseomonas hellenica]
MTTGTNNKPDALPPTKGKPRDGAAAKQRQDEKQHQEDMLDEALEETFPASDPISPATPRKD